MSLASKLEEGLETLKLDLGDAGKRQLLAYLALLVKWNRAYNLTAIRDPEEMVTQHLLDSLSMAPYLENLPTLADIGSGAGLPGIPLAITFPAMEVLSVEANQKKAAFQQQAKIELELKNFSVACDRVEKCQGAFAGVTSRAFAELVDFAAWAGHLVASGGHLLAMKGIYPEDEIRRLPDQWKLTEAIPLHVPGLAAQRHLIVLERR